MSFSVEYKGQKLLENYVAETRVCLVYRNPNKVGPLYYGIQITDMDFLDGAERVPILCQLNH